MARVLLLAAWLLAGCSPATLDVLGPGPGKDAADGAADATLDVLEDADAGESGVDAPGSDVAAEPDSAGGSDATEEVPPTGVGCEGQGSVCTFAGQCCSLACGTVGSMPAGSCSVGPPCSSAAGACTTGVDCCSSTCMAGKCAPSPPMCKPAGEACGGNGECCAQLCSAGHCALLEGCRVQGEICGSSADCCTSLCQLDAQSVGHCIAWPMCTENDHKMCTRQVGEICGGNDDCCSRECVPLAGGLKRCAPGGGCRGECELCSSGADCCSGACSAQDGTLGICQPPSTCAADGETCGGNGDCCPGAMCVNAPPPSGAHRCLDPSGDGACRSPGTTCATPSECCSGFCLESPAGLSCASTCVADGDPCTANADCCSTGSGCMVVHGRLTCEPVLP